MKRRGVTVPERLVEPSLRASPPALEPLRRMRLAIALRLDEIRASQYRRGDPLDLVTTRQSLGGRAARERGRPPAPQREREY